MKVSVAVRLGLAVAGVLLAGVAWAQGPEGRPGEGPGFGEHRPPIERAFGGEDIHGRWWNNPKVVEKLKLIDDQRKGFDGILLQHRETLIDLRGNVEKAELAMEPLMRDDQPNEAKILSQIDKVAQARAELEKANARYLLAIRSKLTPEQWKLVEAFRADRDRGMRDRGPERQGGPGQWGQGKSQRQGGQLHRQTPPSAQPGAGTPGAPPPQGPGPQGRLDDESRPDGPDSPDGPGPEPGI
jgi:Spy/CpxP family protein refolding chaperone